MTSERCKVLKIVVLCVSLVGIIPPAKAQSRRFDIPPADLEKVLQIYVQQSGTQLIYKVDEVGNVRSPGVRKVLSSEDALTALLAGTGFRSIHDASGAVAIVHEPR